MNILFLSISDFNSIYQHEIYPDLLREFMNKGHNVYVVSSLEKRRNEQTKLITEDKAKLLKVRIGNITKTGLVEKGISTILVEGQYKSAIKKYFSDVKFDLVLYSTPPITLAGVVKYIKNRDKAVSYLLLKDIFPQNAVDLGMFKKTGIKGLMYKFFRSKEKKLYSLSDYIGCMSWANVRYILEHNPELNSDRVEVCPNSIDIIDRKIDENARDSIRQKYEIPLDKRVFVYGGNLGRPQGIGFIISCLERLKDSDAYFLIVGDGTEYSLLEEYFRKNSPLNARLMKRLPKEDYDSMIAACDVGLIFLDYRFTIPNFPSRLLAYMQAYLPVIACTDQNTDIGDVIVEGQFGWKCDSDDPKNFEIAVADALKSDLEFLGKNGYRYLKSHYSVTQGYDIIVGHIKERK